MMMSGREWRHALALHGLLAVAALAGYASLHPPRLGMAILGLVIAYNLLLPVWAKAAGFGHWFRAWLCLLPLSVFQVLPDWFLSAGLGVLHFPDLGAPRFETVPVYMAGMWVIPLFWVSQARSIWGAALVALLIFAFAEWFARPLQIWVASGVSQSFGVAHYVLLPEALLGAGTWWLCRQHHGISLRLVVQAAALALCYTGALAVSWTLFER